LQEDLQAARELEANLDISLVWNLPVPYSHNNPLWLETEQQEFQEGAGRAWMYVEPDGDVLPAQGILNVLGNLVEESWEEIWNKTQQAA
jgi:MoaA/NifB/PqqE/SkfB family radical SAM enzyme